MSESDQNESSNDRPPFMAVLGLLPPYELEDVNAAYRDKAFVAHPDQGGDPRDFMRIKEAYDQAVEYVTRGGSLRAWIAAKVGPYLKQEELIAEVLRRGGRVEVEQFAWLEKTWGDGFPLLQERLRHIYVRDMTDGDSFLAFLADRRPANLMGLDLTGSRVSGEGLRHLKGLQVMRWLNVSGTDVNSSSLKSLLSSLPSLEWLNVRETRLGWWGRWRLRRARPRLRVVTEPSAAVKAGNDSIDSHDCSWQN